MPLYYFILIFMLLLIIIRFGRSYFSREKDFPVELFAEGLKNENDGDFEAAVLNYETALDNFKTSRFHCGLRNKIEEKLKVLHTIVEYKNNLRFTR